MASNSPKFPWQDKIINNGQIGGIETSVLDNGPGRSTRIAWINTGSGLRYKVVIDRGMDIVDAFYNQYSLAWLSHGGITVPRHDANRDIEWLYSFAGGLLTTCGLTHVGPPEADENQPRGLHGRISNIPASIESIIQPDPVAGKLDMSITGVLKQSRLFGPNLELKRTISGRIGEPTIQIHDEVTNRANVSVPHMILYHCNFGWPLVDAGTDIIYKGQCVSRGLKTDDAIFNSNRNFRKCCKPLETHRGAGEGCGFIDVAADKGICTVGLANRKLNLAVAMKYKKKQLPCLTNWQHWGFGEYLTGIEPGTNPPIGQNKARQQNKLIHIAAGKSRKYDLQISVITNRQQIKTFINSAG